MDPFEEEQKAILLQCFRDCEVIGREERANLRFHRSIGTKVLCGQDAGSYTNENAG